MPGPVTTYAQYQRRHWQVQEGVRNAQFEHQRGGCALCGVQTRLVVDHCHASGRLRGLLCLSCNVLMAGVDKGDDWPRRTRRYRDRGVWKAKPRRPEATATGA